MPSPSESLFWLSIEADSFRVEGYFEETKLHDIRVGQSALVKLMGEEQVISGHVQSIASGIEDRDRVTSANLLPNVTPTVSWVRLAQRVPVRVTLDSVPPDIRLIVGRTATVTILPGVDTD
ncbi:MAG: HlyD family efflux transporter periplasmic adaptor subunit [Rhodopseudomonas palustris]|nr:HlyD family efflux transporter periplasmic adaptor subunit [Rhodopseudomonas palustris]